MLNTKVPVPTELYTTKTMFTLGGGSAAVWIFTTVLAWVFEIEIEKYKWIGLCVALALSFIGAFRLRTVSLSLLTVAFFNGLLIYITAVGIDSINQGIKVSKTEKAALISFTTNKAWWPPAALVDTIKFRKEQMIEAHKKYQQLKQNNQSLRDSLNVMAATFQMTLQGNDALRVCSENNRQLKSDLNECRNRPPKTIIETHVEHKNPNETLKVSLNELKRMNSLLLNDLEQYLKKGTPDAGDLYALKEINEKIYSFKLQLTEANDKIDKLSKQEN